MASQEDQNDKEASRHVVELMRGSEKLDLLVEDTGDYFHVTARWEDAEYEGSGDFFQDALDGLRRRLPAEAAPKMCGACRHGHLDPYGASNGIDDISCFRDRKDLSRDFARHGRQASPEAEALLYKRNVTAWESCDEFEPRPERQSERGLITAAFLDAGGVLLDESAMERSRAEATTRHLRFVVPGYSTARYWADVGEAVRVFCPNVYLYVFWKYLKPDRQRCEAAYAEFLSAWRPAMPPLRLMPGITEEIRRLSAQVRIGIAGQYGGEMLTLLEEHDLLDAFTWTFTQDDFSLTKPDPRYFEQILHRCGVRPDRSVMVGDRIDKDVIPTKQVGMRTIRVRVGLHRDQQARVPSEAPDVELDSVNGLAAAIEKLAAV
ncbi:HAD family hydrolase [Planctomycetota bacterium]